MFDSQKVILCFICSEFCSTVQFDMAWSGSEAGYWANESFFSAARRHGADRGARRGRTGEVGGARPRAADRTAT